MYPLTRSVQIIIASSLAFFFFRFVFVCFLFTVTTNSQETCTVIITMIMLGKIRTKLPYVRLGAL